MRELLFTLPNTYPFSGHVVHTCDLFFRVEIAKDAVLRAADDAAELFWLPLSEVRPELFGLKSVSEGVAYILDVTQKSQKTQKKSRDA